MMNTDWLTIAMQVMEDLFEGIKLIPQRCGLSLFDPAKHLPLQGLHGTFISIHAEVRLSKPTWADNSTCINTSPTRNWGRLAIYNDIFGGRVMPVNCQILGMKTLP